MQLLHKESIRPHLMPELLYLQLYYLIFLLWIKYTLKLSKMQKI